MLGYLKNWELSVQEREGYQEHKLEQQKMLLSQETRLGCKLSGIARQYYNIFTLYLIIHIHVL